MACKFCQNWNISKAREFNRLTEVAGPERIAQAACDTNSKSVAFTYNDPVIFAEYAMDIADACRERDIKTVAVTAGYIGKEARVDFFKKMDAANVDLKAFTESFYKKVCAGELKPVLETLLYLKNETSVWFEITNLIIPGLNDSDNELNAMTEWIVENLGVDVPLHFTAFHPDFRMTNRPNTSMEILRRARAIGLKNGLHYVYTGNTSHVDSRSTYCPNCKKCLIERDWYELRSFELAKDCCPKCGQAIKGHFESVPGVWGNRRQSVRLDVP